MARPRIEVDKDQIEKLAILGCSNVEIAYVIGISVDTLSRRFAELIDKGRAKRRVKLRQLIWQSAERGNIAMQIFLAKNVLGMSDEKPSDPAHNATDEEVITSSKR